MQEDVLRAARERLRRVGWVAMANIVVGAVMLMWGSAMSPIAPADGIQYGLLGVSLALFSSAILLDVSLWQVQLKPHHRAGDGWLQRMARRRRFRRLPHALLRKDTWPALSAKRLNRRLERRWLRHLAACGELKA